MTARSEPKGVAGSGQNCPLLYWILRAYDKRFWLGCDSENGLISATEKLFHGQAFVGKSPDRVPRRANINYLLCAFVDNHEASMKVVGLDCATVDAKVGLALGILGERGLEVQQTTLCTRERAAASVIAGWVRDSQDPVLIAIDAPLGWRNHWRRS
jgi:hypothetical protein